ncbi:MAG TPA: putative 2OG-Fe(II) oxygenase [Allosphingosinicella sp.]|jgi:tetratricopeptide (TPR) repeat protein
MKWQEEVSSQAWERLTAVARQAVASSPAKPSGWRALARLLRQQGAVDEARSVLQEAVVALPNDPDLRLALVGSLMAADELDQAGHELDVAAHLAPEDRRITLFRFALACRRDSTAEAAELASEVDRLQPDSPALISYLRKRARSADELQAVVERCDAAVARRPSDLDPLYHKAIALAKLGRRQEAADLMRPDELPEVRDLSPPEGFEAHTDFSRRLADEILADPTLQPDPKNKATRGGRQTRGLQHVPGSVLAAVVAQIKEAVEEYAARQAVRSSLMAAAMPARASLDRWAVVYGKGGRQVSHRHPKGWISGVYYVSGSQAAGRGIYPGALLLGSLDPDECDGPLPWTVRTVEPVPGRLVMFPSYLPHGTEPAAEEGTRISIAFDVVAAD